ncbi:DNA translocase FtsK, partial [bacterium]|nr:DNA translocase FtsK [bacterium]
ESKDGDGEDEEDSEKVVSLKGLGKKSAVEPKILARADAKKSRRTSKQLEFVNISSNYLFPPLSLLDSEEQVTVKVDEEALKSNSKILELKLKDFDVEGRVTEIHPGPVITMYEFEPSAGTKVSKIANLQSDLSLNMGGRSIRVVPHLPGKAAVGIEVPNYEREIVWLKDIIADPKFKKSKTKLPLAIGKDTEGNSLISDLTKMPHLLIAGATGTGKSVCINAMICSILYKAQPEEVRFLMIDPKMLELSIYDGIPHLLLPVVTRPKKAVVAFNWAVREMERRYRTLADAAVRSIVGYNEKIDKGGLKLVDEEKADEMLIQNPEAVCHVGKLPYIVIIVDELADLMMTASKDIEESITRLAQMARAVGIHLILATQRPSVDVITGLIKANFPCRLSFKVSAKHDSRTILDQNGADHLLGNGDMLFLAPGAQGLKRAHGAFITEVEIERVVAHIKKQGEPVYNEDILKTQESGLAGTLGDEEHDELYDTAIKLVAETHQASISMIQRKLRIGYNRAARMVEMMEEQGIVGPQDGSKPREVLISNLE